MELILLSALGTTVLLTTEVYDFLCMASVAKVNVMSKEAMWVFKRGTEALTLPLTVRL
jgi:hypothetical protein